MRFRRQYTLFQRTRNGKKYWYFRIYLPDGTRKAKSTGCRSKEKAICYVETCIPISKLGLELNKIAISQ